MSKLLEGRTVLLTGASRGIGKELASTLSKEGAKLIMVAHPQHEDDLKQCAKSCEAAGEGACECETHCVDFADSQAVKAFAEQMSGKDISVLINNAGDPDVWERTMKVNALAPMRLIRALSPMMADKGEGWIINIGDVEAVHEGPHHPAYAASKHALRGFGLSSYEMLRSKGVKVVDLAPGNVEHTGMVEKSDKAGGQGAIDPHDVAEAVLFCFRLSANAVPEEIVIKAVKPGK